MRISYTLHITDALYNGVPAFMFLLGKKIWSFTASRHIRCFSKHISFPGTLSVDICNKYQTSIYGFCWKFSFIIYLYLQFDFFLQISASTPFKGDIAFVSGTDLDSARVDERVSSLTGAFCIQPDPVYYYLLCLICKDVKFIYLDFGT